jgi:hypothetical protein
MHCAVTLERPSICAPIHASLSKSVRSLAVRIMRPDHNDDATRQVARGKVRRQNPLSGFYRPVFPSPIQGASGPDGSNRRIQRATV